MSPVSGSAITIADDGITIEAELLAPELGLPSNIVRPLQAVHRGLQHIGDSHVILIKLNSRVPSSPRSALGKADPSKLAGLEKKKYAGLSVQRLYSIKTPIRIELKY
ncbi:MAG: hypothetical protein ACI9UU_001690 [Candidatus Azotimanducaceae bacterium]|jgi:hypothetical protein